MGIEMWGDRATVTYDRIWIGGFPDCVAEATSGLFEQCFPRRSHEKRNVGLRNGEAGRIDRRGERGFDQPPHEPSPEFLPFEAQCCPQASLEKPFALRWVEPRPALHRGLEQITRHLATFQNENSASETQKTEIANMLRCGRGFLAATSFAERRVSDALADDIGVSHRQSRSKANWGQVPS
jgi:hypothetical protein